MKGDHNIEALSLFYASLQRCQLVDHWIFQSVNPRTELHFYAVHISIAVGAVSKRI